MASLEILERLAANPHYKMTKRQIEELNRLRREQSASRPVQHRTDFDTHPTGFDSHPTSPPRQEDGDEPR